MIPRKNGWKPLFGGPLLYPTFQARLTPTPISALPLSCLNSLDFLEKHMSRISKNYDKIIIIQ